MKIDSWRKMIQYGFIHSVIIMLTYVCFCCIVYALVDGQYFINKGATEEILNGISFNTIRIVGVGISALANVLLLRYTHFKYLFVYIIVRSMSYIALYALIFLGMSVAFDILGDLSNFPLNTFDSIYYALAIFPLGSVIGIIIAVVINTIRNMQQAKSSENI